jgi:iron only hydrogenase large subunit-like protein
VIRSFCFLKLKKEPDKQIFKKLRSGGNFREISLTVGESEIRAAVIDGLTGLEKLSASLASGKNYDLIEVMTCPGGCVHGAGLPFSPSKDEIKSRAKLVYQADDTMAINLPCKSPTLINLYEKYLKENNEIADKKIFYTHFEKRDVLL